LTGKLKNKITAEYRIFRKEVAWLEYAFWWVVRAAIIYALVKSLADGDPRDLALRLSAKLLSSFMLPVLHLLPRKIFIAKLSYRVQTIASVMLLLTAVLGQFKGYYSSVEWFDAYLHTFGCFVCVFAGYELTMALKRDNFALSPLVGAMSGFGFSFFFAVAWEIFEFTSDTLMTGGNSQNWSFYNSDGLLAYFPDIEPQRYALLDTMTDLIFGAVGSILGGIALLVYLRIKNKKNK